MKTGIVIYPGSNCDTDAYNAVKNVLGMDARYIWYQDDKIDELDLIVLPGGFSYGDYLRCGAIARFAEVSTVIKGHADKGKFVMGICNGFQILTEMGLLPGALIRNIGLKFICKDVYLKVENNSVPFTKEITKPVIKIPIAHGEGNYRIDSDGLKKLYDNNQIIFKYSSLNGDTCTEHNPNGSIDNIAGICNEAKNVLGMMPHPERVCEQILGGDDGRLVFNSLLN